MMVGHRRRAMRSPTFTAGRIPPLLKPIVSRHGYIPPHAQQSCYYSSPIASADRPRVGAAAAATGHAAHVTGRKLPVAHELHSRMRLAGRAPLYARQTGQRADCFKKPSAASGADADDALHRGLSFPRLRLARHNANRSFHHDVCHDEPY